MMLFSLQSNALLAKIPSFASLTAIGNALTCGVSASITELEAASVTGLHAAWPPFARCSRLQIRCLPRARLFWTSDPPDISVVVFLLTLQAQPVLTIDGFHALKTVGGAIQIQVLSSIMGFQCCAPGLSSGLLSRGVLLTPVVDDCFHFAGLAFRGRYLRSQLLRAFSLFAERHRANVNQGIWAAIGGLLLIDSNPVLTSMPVFPLLKTISQSLQISVCHP
jgi:hypothetical protein